VVQILIVIVTFVVDLPASIYLGGDFASILQNQEATDVLTIFTDPIYLLLVGLSYLVKFILYVISTIVAVFIYFDIKEQKNPTSDDFIDEIGMG